MYCWCLPTEECNPARMYSWHVTTHSQLQHSSTPSVMTTRKDKMENHPPSHPKSHPFAWPSKGSPFLYRWTPFIAVKDLSDPLLWRNPADKFRQTEPNTREREKKANQSHAAIWQFGFRYFPAQFLNHLSTGVYWHQVPSSPISVNPSSL